MRNHIIKQSDKLFSLRVLFNSHNTISTKCISIYKENFDSDLGRNTVASDYH